MELVRQNEKLTGMDRILLERARQVNDKKFDSARDDKYRSGELRRAAQCYETAALNADDTDDVAPKGWPWDLAGWKPRGILRNLEKAGALYQADIDRIRRKDPNSTSEILLFLEKRIQIIAEEIDRFLAPLVGDPHLMKDTNKKGETRHSFQILNALNVENSEMQKFIESGQKRPADPLYFDGHLRRKLAIAKLALDPNPTGSILNRQEVCTCPTGILCEHRLEWLMAYLKRAHYNIMVRLHESFSTVEQLTLQLEEAKEQIQQMTFEERNRDAINDLEES